MSALAKVVRLLWVRRLALALAVALVLLALVSQARQYRDYHRCQGNLGALWRAAMAYEQDFGTLPLTPYRTGVYAYVPEPDRPPSPRGDVTFVDCLAPYLSDRRVLVCPRQRWALRMANPEARAGSSYTYNEGASGLRLDQVKVPSDKAPLFLDVPATGSGHWGLFNVGFLDGSVRRCYPLFGSYPLWYGQTWPDL